MIQIPISKYFKSTSSAPLKMNKDVIRKRKSELFSSMSTEKNKDQNDVINLISDTEDELTLKTEEIEDSDIVEPLLNVECVMSESDSSFSSTKSIIYRSPQTPTKVLGTPKSSSSQSSGRRYSPYKNRTVAKRSPLKRNLALNLFETYSELCNSEQETKDTSHIFKDIDDKTNFLQQIINKYLTTSELRPLLDQKSQDFLLRSVKLGTPGMRLVCRLYWRKHCWYRRDKLAPIMKGKQTLGSNQIQEILENLVKHGFLTQAEGGESLNFNDCTNLLQHKQCIELCKSLSLKCSDTTKTSAIMAMTSYSRSKPIDTYFLKSGASNRVNNADRVLKLMQEKLGPCYRLSDRSREVLNKLYLLMYLSMDYSLIRDKKLELTLINNKNGIETYPIDKRMHLDNASVVFKSHIEFQRYYEAHNDYESFLSKTDLKEKIDFIQRVFEKYNCLGSEELKNYKALPVWLRRFTPAYLYIKIVEDGVVDLKRDEKYQLAVDILTSLVGQNAFRQHKKGEWYAEKALILHKYMRQYDTAGDVLLEGLNSTIPKALKQTLICRAKQLVSQKNIKLEESIAERLFSALSNNELISEKDFSADHVFKQHMDREGKGKKRFITRTDDEFTAHDAENYCISHYIREGHFTNGWHWEGGIVTTIFTLLFWDIIYMTLRGYSGIFMSPYQVYPLDMFSAGFYENRKEIIEERLRWIENSTTESLREEMRKVWDSRPESEISGINRSLGWENVQQVCEYAGARHLASLCRRLAADYAYAHSGFPDLTLWNSNTKQIKFVEVKTDTDKPSIKQLQWMHYLQSVGIDTGFCYVGVNTERSTARTRRSDQQTV